MATLECLAAMWHVMLIVFSSVLGSLNQDKQTNNSKRCDSVLFANLTYLKIFCKVEKDSERSLTFLAPIFISVQFPVGKWESLLATFNFISTLFLQLANKFGKHDLSHQGSHGIVFTRWVTLERLVATQACLWSKVKFCTRPEGWCSWVAKKGLGAKKVSFDTLPRPCIGRSVKVSLDSIAVSLFVNYETTTLSTFVYSMVCFQRMMTFYIKDIMNPMLRR